MDSDPGFLDSLIEDPRDMTILNTFGGNADFARTLTKAQVEFLVVGGLAVVFHNCRDPLKVDDLDLLLNPSPENAERFIECCWPRDLMPLPTVAQVAKPNLQIPLKIIPLFNLDILTPPQHIDFGELSDRSESALLQGNIPVRVISRRDLIMLKQIAIQNLSKDKQKHENDLRYLEASIAGEQSANAIEECRNER
jgi:hypothetical protein